MLFEGHTETTIRNADQIVVFEHGRIVEISMHTELSKKDGVCACLQM